MAAVEQEADRARLAGLTVEVDVTDLPPLDAAVEVAAFRIVAEAVTNIVRHAGARHATVRLALTDGELMIMVADDGPASRTTRWRASVVVDARALRRAGWAVPGDLAPTPRGGTVVRAWFPAGTRKRYHDQAESVRVLIADDHPVFRDGLASLLAPRSDIEVVGRAADGIEAVQLCRDLAPDVVIMDIQMPRLNGIEATRQVTAAQPEIGILVITMGEDDSTVFAAIRAGARGYLLKGADQAEIIRAITTVHAGGVVFGASWPSASSGCSRVRPRARPSPSPS